MSHLRGSVSLLYLTRDRLHYTRATVQSLDDERVGVLWYDDSDEPDAQRFALDREFQHARLLGRKRSGARGPAQAIEAGLRELLTLSEAEWIGYYENDMLADDGWIDGCFRAVAAAEADGWPVGAVSPLSALARTFLLSESYGLVWTIGQVVLFRREIVPEILRTWRAYSTFRTMRRSFARAGLDISENPYFRWSATTGGLGAPVGADWNIATTLLNLGQVTVVPVPSRAQDLDRPHSYFGTRAVELGDRQYQLAHLGEPASVAKMMLGEWAYPLTERNLLNATLHRIRRKARALAAWLAYRL